MNIIKLIRDCHVCQYTAYRLHLFVCLCICGHVHPLTGQLAPDWRDEWLIAWCGELGQGSWLWPIGVPAEAAPLGPQSQLSWSVIGHICFQSSAAVSYYNKGDAVTCSNCWFPLILHLSVQALTQYGWEEVKRRWQLEQLLQFNITDKMSIDDDHDESQRGAFWSISIKISVSSAVW